jgi:hypothetical protein
MKPVEYRFTETPSNSTNLAQKTEILANEKLMNLKLNVTNGGLSDMTSPYDLVLSNEDISIVECDQKTDGVRHITIDPLKTRETKTVTLTVKVQDDSSGKFSKQLQDKSKPLEIGFKLNEFNNNPFGSQPREQE